MAALESLQSGKTFSVIHLHGYVCVAWKQSKRIPIFLVLGMFPLWLHHQQLRGATFQIQETFFFPSPKAVGAIRARGHGWTSELRCREVQIVMFLLPLSLYIRSTMVLVHGWGAWDHTVLLLLLLLLIVVRVLQGLTLIQIELVLNGIPGKHPDTESH